MLLAWARKGLGPDNQWGFWVIDFPGLDRQQDFLLIIGVITNQKIVSWVINCREVKL